MSGSKGQVSFFAQGCGSERAEGFDATDRPIPGFTEEDSDKISGDAVDHLVSWNGQSDVLILKGKPVKLRFIMRDAKLYAFQFVASAKTSRREP